MRQMCKKVESDEQRMFSFFLRRSALNLVNNILVIESTHHRHLERNNEQLQMTIVSPVAEGRPGDVLLAVAEHAHPPAPERLLAVVDDVPGVMEEAPSYSFRRMMPWSGRWVMWNR